MYPRPAEVAQIRAESGFYPQLRPSRAVFHGSHEDFNSLIFITILASPGRSWFLVWLLSSMVRFYIWSTFGLHAVDFRAVAPVAGDRVVQSDAQRKTR
jgi:hypothetical protein